jgi:uncharacterized protein (DUF1778 family)
MDPDKELNYDKLEPTDIIAVIIPSPNVEQESTRRFQGINSRGGISIVNGTRAKQAPLQIRFSHLETEMLEAASAQIGVKRHHFIRQAALSMAEAVLNGSRSEDHPNTRVSLEGYRRRHANNFSES